MAQNTNASFTNAGAIANSQTANKLDTSVSDAVKQGIISQADVDEFKATGSISDAAKNKIKDYQSGVAGTAAPADGGNKESSSYQEGLNTAIDENKQTEADLIKLKEEELANSEKTKDEIIASEKQYADDIKKLEDENLAAQAELDRQEKARIAKAKEDEINNLRAQQEQDRIEKDLEKQKLQADAELLRQKNERALIEAEKNIYVEQQRSAWAYNKIGLGFSSGVINQSQQIATNGISKIAEIRAQMNYNERVTGIQQAQIMAQLNKIDLEYTNLVNSAINNAAKEEADIDRNLRDRLTAYNRNMTLTLKEKNDVTQKAISDWEKDKNSIERQHISDMQAIANRGLELSQKLQAETERLQEVEKVKIADELLTGNLLMLSDDELAKREQAAGLPRGSIKQKTSSAIQSGIRSIVDKTIGQDFVIGDMTKLNNEVIALIKQGRTLPEAVEQVTNKYVKEQPEYKAKQALKAKEAGYKSQMMDLDLEKSKLDIQGKKASIAASNAAAAASRATAIDINDRARKEAAEQQAIALIATEYFNKTGKTLDSATAKNIMLRGGEYTQSFLTDLDKKKTSTLSPSDSKLIDSLKETKDKDDFISAYKKLSSEYGASQAKDMIVNANKDIKVDAKGNLIYKGKEVSTPEIDLGLKSKDKGKGYNYEELNK